MRVFSIGALVAMASLSHGLTLSVDEAMVRVLKPSTGLAPATFSGTLTQTSAGESVVDATVFTPWTLGGASLSFPMSTPLETINASLLATGSYTGVLFEWQVESSTVAGSYIFNYDGTGSPQAFYQSSIAGNDAAQVYGVVVEAVPEPMSATILVVGIAALRRRRGRS